MIVKKLKFALPFLSIVIDQMHPGWCWQLLLPLFLFFLLLLLLKRMSSATCTATAAYQALHVGQPGTLSHRIFLTKAGSNSTPLSPFHDVPLWADRDSRIANMFVEIPRFSNAKMEISKEEWMNPVKQDVKKGQLRFVKNCFPHRGYPWNYGALPQTWESPEQVDKATGLKGDNDPIDAVEIGGRVQEPGTVIQVKILGSLALLDEGETDWKVIVIDVTDPLAKHLNDISDLDKHCPGLLEATRHWFRVYKVPDGKPENSFAFEGQAKDRSFTLQVIEETHEAWKGLVQKGSAQGISVANVTQSGSSFFEANPKAIEDGQMISLIADRNEVIHYV